MTQARPTSDRLVQPIGSDHSSALAVFRDADGQMSIAGVEVEASGNDRLAITSPSPIAPGRPLTLRGLSGSLGAGWRKAIAVGCVADGDRWRIGVARAA